MIDLTTIIGNLVIDFKEKQNVTELRRCLDYHIQTHTEGVATQRIVDILADLERARLKASGWEEVFPFVFYQNFNYLPVVVTFDTAYQQYPGQASVTSVSIHTESEEFDIEEFFSGFIQKTKGMETVKAHPWLANLYMTHKDYLDIHCARFEITLNNHSIKKMEEVAKQFWCLLGTRPETDPVYGHAVAHDVYIRVTPSYIENKRIEVAVISGNKEAFDVVNGRIDLEEIVKKVPSDLTFIDRILMKITGKVK